MNWASTQQNGTTISFLAGMPIGKPWDHAIGQAFTAVALLTQSVKRAEEAVLSAFHTLTLDELNSQKLSLKAIEWAMANPQGPKRCDEQTEEFFLTLPGELQSLNGLAPALRSSFVLRVLVGLKSDVCATILRLSRDQLKDDVCAAMLSLAETEAVNAGCSN